MLVFAPDCTRGFSRTEKDLGKIKAMWQHGLDHGRARAAEVRAYLE